MGIGTGTWIAQFTTEYKLCGKFSHKSIDVENFPADTAGACGKYSHE